MKPNPEPEDPIVAEICRAQGFPPDAFPTQIDGKKADDIKISTLMKSKTASKLGDRSPGRHDLRSMMILFAVILSGMAIFAGCSGISSFSAPAFHKRKQRPLCAHVVSHKFANEISIQLFQIEIK